LPKITIRNISANAQYQIIMWIVINISLKISYGIFPELNINDCIMALVRLRLIGRATFKILV